MGDRTRVLIIVAGIAIGEPLGGAERFGIELARNLDQNKIEPILCAFWHHGVPSERYWVDSLTKAGVEVFFAAEWERGPGGLVKYANGLGNITARFQDRPVDVIHSTIQIGSIAALLLKRPLHAQARIRTALAGKEWGGTLLGFLCRQVFTQWVFPAVFDVEVGVSRAKISDLDHRLGARLARKKARLIYNGISLDQFVESGSAVDKRLELGLPLDALVVGSIGRLQKEKGYSIFLDAAAIVKTQMPCVKFPIVGDGKQAAYLRQKADRLGLSDIVLFVGARQDVAPLFRMMDLFVLPSLWEGLPTVVMEGMACGVPIVATDIPGTRELVAAGQTGWLAKPGDPESLAACILEALSNPAKRKRVATTALREVVPHFSMQGIADQYEQVYSELTRA